MINDQREMYATQCHVTGPESRREQKWLEKEAWWSVCFRVRFGSGSHQNEQVDSSLHFSLITFPYHQHRLDGT